MNTQTLNIALPEDLVKKVDKLAKKEFRNSESFEELFTYGKSVAKKMHITNEEQVNKIVADYRHDKKST